MADAQRSRGANARWSDEQVEQFIGTLLRVGVIVAATVGALGGVLYLVQHGMQPVSYAEFRGESDDLRGVTGIVRGALALRAMSIVQLGLLLLIATPIARVALALAAFVLQRDRAYVAITAVVLALLLISLFGGLPG